MNCVPWLATVTAHTVSCLVSSIISFTNNRVQLTLLCVYDHLSSDLPTNIPDQAFYSSTIFIEANYTEKQALLASWGFRLVNFIFAFPAVWTIDSVGVLGHSRVWFMTFNSSDAATCCCSRSPTWPGPSLPLASAS